MNPLIKGSYCFFLLISLIVALAFSLPVIADEPHEGAEHSFHRHHMALFIGNTQEGDENGVSFGADYEYRVNQIFGIGGIVEYAGGEFEHWLGLVSMFIHPYGDWRIIMAPGVEFIKGEDEGDFVFRTGIGYQFHFGERYTIAPEFNVDFGEHETLFVYGISIGLGF
jgi:hypothetical protein